jgi:protein-cysteine N-palmitoyltransferase HHAT
MIHVSYAVAISKAQPDWSLYGPGALSMLGYFNLHHIWLKLLLPWRFFRLWGLVDGVDSPENMTRCMSDNFSALAFWRGWHRSYNRWIVRYIYIPLGGSGTPGGSNNKSWTTQVRSILNFLAVFTFVALWHDIQLRLLMWGWLVTLFVLPEIIGKMMFPARKWQSSPTLYRLMCGVGSVANVLMMMIANLVGFAVGLDGIQGLLSGIFGTAAGLAYLACACGALFTGVQVMYEIRESEARKGISLKC